MDMCRASGGTHWTLAYWNQMILLTQPVLNKCSYKYIDSIINDGHSHCHVVKPRGENFGVTPRQWSDLNIKDGCDGETEVHGAASFQSQGRPSLNYKLHSSLYSRSLLESMNSFGRCLVKSSDWMKSVQWTFSHKRLNNLVSLPKQRNFPPHQQKAEPWSYTLFFT